MRITISNAGEIEMGAVRLMGASTKRDDTTKIGFFGTGMKYALAWLLRSGLKVRIFSGLNEIEVSTRKETLRGQVFDEIYLNGIPTSITTDIGPKWEPWQIIRELYCNAVDEGDPQMSTMANVTPAQGRTTIIIEGDTPMLPLLGVISEREKYFLSNRKPLDHGGDDDMAVLPKISASAPFRIYRKGILVYEGRGGTTDSLFDWEIPFLPINEERQITDVYSAMLRICTYILCEAKNPKVLEAFFASSPKTIENQAMYYADSVYSPISEAFQKEMVKHYIAPMGAEEYSAKKYKGVTIRYLRAELYNKLAKLPNVKVAFRHHSTAGSYEPMEMQEWQKKMLDEALQILAPHLSTHVPIEYVEFARRETIAAALDEKILLSSRAFGDDAERPLLSLVSTLIEEIVHVETKAADNTRKMQTALTDLAAKVMLAFRDGKAQPFVAPTPTSLDDEIPF